MIEFSETTDGFTLSYNGKLIIAHSEKNPCVIVGTGTGSYNMSHSGFRIKDKISGRLKLSSFKIEDSSSGGMHLLLGNILSMHIDEIGDRLEFSFRIHDSSFNRFWIKIPAAPKEHVYGFGEQFTELDMRGRKIPIWVQEQGIGRGRGLTTLLANIQYKSGGSWHTTCFAQPTFVSSEKFFCHVETSSYSEFDFTNKKFHILHAWDIPKKIIIGVEESAAETIGGLSAYLGRQPNMPDWAYDGVWLGVQGGADSVRGKFKDAQIAGVRVAAIWAQDWAGRRITSFGKQLIWDWKHDPEMYPDLKNFIKDLNSKGIKFLGYINPFLAIGTSDDENALTPADFLYNEAKHKNYCAKDANGKDYYVKITTYPAAMLDLTNPEAFEWIKGIIKKNMIEFGLHGWAADFAEHLPIDSVLHSGKSAEKAHCEYPVLWAKANREAVEESGRGKDIVFFMRSGFSGASKYAGSIWAGDQLVNWSMDNGLAAAIPAGISLGISGIGYYHSDIGGSTTAGWIKRSKELFMRWAEHSAFTQTMRTHEGNRPDANWQFNSDEETLSHFAHMSKIYVHIKPYHKHVASEYSSKGLPPMRHPFIHYEGDELLHRFKYQYLYGRDLFIAPVYKPSVSTMKIYLPTDEWVHVWTGRRFKGGWCEVNSPIGEPPVFYKSDSAFAGIFEGLRSL